MNKAELVQKIKLLKETPLVSQGEIRILRHLQEILGKSKGKSISKNELLTYLKKLELETQKKTLKTQGALEFASELFNSPSTLEPSQDFTFSEEREEDEEESEEELQSIKNYFGLNEYEDDDEDQEEDDNEI